MLNNHKDRLWSIFMLGAFKQQNLSLHLHRLKIIWCKNNPSAYDGTRAWTTNGTSTKLPLLEIRCFFNLERKVQDNSRARQKVVNRVSSLHSSYSWSKPRISSRFQCDDLFNAFLFSVCSIMLNLWTQITARHNLCQDAPQCEFTLLNKRYFAEIWSNEPSTCWNSETSFKATV